MIWINDLSCGHMTHLSGLRMDGECVSVADVSTLTEDKERLGVILVGVETVVERDGDCRH